jgi:DNA-binding XRE family transcriptional regulator
MRIVLKNFFSALTRRKQGFESPRERHRGFCLHKSRGARGLIQWSQTQLAKKAAVSVSTVADFENGRRLPIPNNLAAIRRALEDAGVKFLNAGKSGGAGVRLRE